MARQGDVLENPATGERLVFRRTAADSGGAVLAFDYFLPAGGSVPLAHVHPRQEERFEILSGRARIRVGRRLRRATAGESVLVPRGTVHRLWNEGGDELHAVVEFRPALRTEKGFEQLLPTRLRCDGARLIRLTVTSQGRARVGDVGVGLAFAGSMVYGKACLARTGASAMRWKRLR